MARYTTFGAVNSDTDLHMIQQSVAIEPAKPKLHLVDIPGADGSRDLTDALGVGVKYYDRTLTWTYAVRPGDNWMTKYSEVSTALNGKRMNIVLDTDPDWMYNGRVSVESYHTDRTLHQIIIKASCSPYKRRRQDTSQAVTVGAGTQTTVTLPIGGMPQVPSIMSLVAADLSYNGKTAAVRNQPAPQVLPDLYMTGNASITIDTTGGAGGVITFTWREGSL